MSKTKMMRKSRRKILFWVISGLLLLYSASFLMPVYYMLINSFKRIDDFLERGCWAFPKEFYFENYINVFHLEKGNLSFVSMFFNSIVFTFSAVAINVATMTVMSYVLARYRFRGRNFLVAVAVGALVIPDLGSAAVVYKMFLDLNMIDTWFILVKYTSPFGLGFLIIYSLFKTVSWAYTEAAHIDGAGEITIFIRICLPMAYGTIGAITVITAIGCWNDYYTPYMYLPTIKTLSVGLQELSMTLSQFEKPMLFAGMVTAVAPLIVLFIAMRDTIIKNTVSGGLKG